MLITLSSLFFVPLISGGLIRFLLRKYSYSWTVTIAFAAAAFVFYLIAMDPPVIGNEAYGIRMTQSMCLFGASFITGCFIRLKDKK